jgi:hypothetical protein
MKFSIPYSGVLLGLALAQTSAFALEKPTGISAETRANHIRVNRELTWSTIENLITLNEFGLAGSVLEEHLAVDPKDGKSWLFKS